MRCVRLTNEVNFRAKGGGWEIGFRSAFKSEGGGGSFN